MEKIKIQIIHEGLITKKQLSNILYDEIGEKYNFSEDDIEDLFEHLDSFILPNNNFSTTFTLSLPDLELRDIEPKDIVISFLKSLQSDEKNISIVKTFDSILHKTAERYYKEVIEIEMELRNVLTYILSYDEKNIEDQLFKNFGINKSEKNQDKSMRDNFENGLFYIYFNHYANFSEPQKLKAEQIVELLQEPTIRNFDDFKSKISDRAIKEDRHTDFLLSIKTKLRPLEDMRNAIMHIRNLSKNVIDNYEIAMKDDNGDKGVRTLINNFWKNERTILNQKTWLALAEYQIKKLITIVDNNTKKFYKMNDDYYEYEFMEGYFNLEDFREELISYLDERIELNNFNSSTDDFQIKINDLINRLLR